MNKSIISGTADGRPYRSHRVPACSACRRRKIRCQVDHTAQACRFCRGRQMACDFSYGRPELTVGPASEEPSRLHTTLSTTLDSPLAVTGEQIRQVAPGPTSSPSESSPLLMNPTMAEDVDILERYLTSNTLPGSEEAWPYIHVSHTGTESIVYHRVPRHRKGLRTAMDPGRHSAKFWSKCLGASKPTLSGCAVTRDASRFLG